MSRRAEQKPPERLSWRPRSLAQAHELSPSMVYGAIYSGELRARQLRGKVWLIAVEDADEWIKRISTENVEHVPAA